MEYAKLALLEDKREKIGKCDNYLYSRKGAVFTADKPLEAGKQYSIVLEFADSAVSYIAVSVSGASVSALAGYTSCTTGRNRTGVFAFTPHENKEAIRAEIFSPVDILGVTVYLGVDAEAVELSKGQRVRPDEVKPKIDAPDGMQLIIACGADSPEREQLPDCIERLREQCPMFREMGFNGVESYVKWNFVEYKQGVFDWSYYDAVIAVAYEYGMKWFPLIIGGSAYALPQWYRELPDFTGFKCLEHGEENNVPTIFNEQQTPYIQKYLHELGRHYEGDKRVFGIRLGPSGNYGESQYPATGNWGYNGQVEHMHIGWWAGDKFASGRFSDTMREKYGDISRLNEAWDCGFTDFSEIKTFIPSQVSSKRRRKDFVDWYVDEMTSWCNRWGGWVRDELKSHDIYQSAGGWGFCELGTDFTDQAQGMVSINGGIRATNEDESYELNFAITRMISSAARFYKIPFGSEPAGYGTARSIVNRLYNIVANNGAHFFCYGGNFTSCDESIPFWLESAAQLKNKAEPLCEVAVMYPDTLTKLSDSALRYLDGSAFFSQVFPFRRKTDFDFFSERMIVEGAADNGECKVLVFLSRGHDGDWWESKTLEAVDAWVQRGGTVIYPILHSNALNGPHTVEGDDSIYKKWLSGLTGEGKVIFVNTLREPLDDYIDKLADILLTLDSLSGQTKNMLSAEKPRGIYICALKNGKYVIYNDKEEKTVVRLCGREYTLSPLSVTSIEP